MEAAAVPFNALLTLVERVPLEQVAVEYYGDRLMAEKRRKSSMPAGSGVGLGIALGVAFGAAFDNVGLGLALGIAFGAALDATRAKRRKGGKD